MKKWIFIALIAFGGGTSLFADQVSFMNDSPFILTATILSADGTHMQTVTLQPGDMRNWTVPTNVPTTTNSRQSLTPFTVIWKCDYKGFYAMCTNVSPGSLVTANMCDGSKYCEPKPKKKKDQEHH